MDSTQSKVLKGTKCVIYNLKSMSTMNGQLCKIVGSYRLTEQRYPVYVYKTKEIVLIKPINLKLVKIKHKETQYEALKSILYSITNRPRTNTAKLFAKCLIQSNPQNQFNNELNKDLSCLLNGNCVYIESFFKHHAMKLFNYLRSDLQDIQFLNFRNHNDCLLMMHQTQNRNISITFNMIVDKLSKYFDIEIKNALINLYKNGNDYKPFHCDGYDDKEVDITIGASFGAQRDLQFLHKKTKQKFSMPQKNGDVFAFTSKINHRFKHSIPKQINKKCGARYSIIIWGKQRNPI